MSRIAPDSSRTCPQPVLIHDVADRQRLADWIRATLQELRRDSAAKTAKGQPTVGEFTAIATLINVSLVTIGRAEP